MLALPIFLGRPTDCRCRLDSPADCQRQNSPRSYNMEKPRSLERGLCWHYLSSRAVTRQVLSAYMSLTSVFGMGTGGPS